MTGGLEEPFTCHHPPPSSALTGPGGSGTDAGEWATADATHGLAGLGTFPM